MAIQRMIESGRLQARFRIGQPSDIFELEADRMADHVMRMLEPGIGSKMIKNNHAVGPAVQRKCPRCKKYGEAKKKPMRKEANPCSYHSEVPPMIRDVLRSPGQALDSATRDFFEPRFHRDFGDVRIHTDSQAAESAQAVGALAYTMGNHIFFGAGQYASDNESGRKLLAHELTHTIQQSGNGYGANMTSIVPRIQRQSFDPWEIPRTSIGPPYSSPPPPDFDCSVDLNILTKLLTGDTSGAWKVLNCCYSKVPLAGRLCTKDIMDAACKLLPDVCEKKKKEEAPRCNIFGFRPSRSFKGLCCPDSNSYEVKELCCNSDQIIDKNVYPRCCKKPSVPNADRTDCTVPSLKTCSKYTEEKLYEGFMRYSCSCKPDTRMNENKGVCCPIGQNGSSGTCIPEVEKTIGPIPEKLPFSLPGNH